MSEILALLLVVLIAAMVVMVPVWFVAVSRYFSFLSANHPGLYRQMGEPSLFANNTPSNNTSFLRYVCGSDYIASGDDQLVSKSRFLKRFFYSYLVIFVAVIIGVAGVGNS
ncbi:hypothetical protein FMN52_19115 [Marinobacter sp. BW6]|uniref:hypothetical protein n=1 Tax=Marinobacter sp. BW6 TaxID=2592624 RepID=UPI0011DEFEC0|nr:hypothetical protein [Marinobacter sp. BW6]TYC53229.1 hypothetical protein FMN52_19115 [Marinobacter sp. BW6]